MRPRTSASAIRIRAAVQAAAPVIAQSALKSAISWPRQLHRLARLLREIATAASAEPGDTALSAGELAIVEDIADHEGTSIGQIAQRTRLAQSLVSKTVARMSAEGVLAITPDSTDGRRVQIKIDPTMRADIFTSRGRRPIASALIAEPTRLNTSQARQVERLLEELASYLLPNKSP